MAIGSGSGLTMESRIRAMKSSLVWRPKKTRVYSLKTWGIEWETPGMHSQPIYIFESTKTSLIKTAKILKFSCL